jgi:hypothetical protein
MAGTKGNASWLEEQARPACGRLSVGGRLEMGTAGTLKERLRELREERQPVRLDLSRLGFVGSTGAGRAGGRLTRPQGRRDDRLNQHGASSHAAERT